MKHPLLCERYAGRLGLMGLLIALFGTGCSEEPSGTTVLRVSNWGSPAVESSFMALEREFREGFEARHPGVRVQIEMIPGEGQYAPKLLMMHVSHHMPDVIHLDASSAAVFIDNGALRDLTPFIEADPEFDLERYFPQVADIYRRGEALYAIPLDFTPMVMFYNKRLFDEAGVAYPTADWTWDDFLDKAKALTRFEEGQAAPVQYGFAFTNWMPGWVLWLWTNGGDVLSPDGSRASGYFNGPRSVEAVQFIVDMIQEHHVAPSLTESAAAGIDLFRGERAAMDLKGHWMLVNYRADGLEVGVAPLPRRTPEPVTVVYAAGLAITSQCRHPDLAWEYVKYMTSTEVQVRRVAPGLAISGNREAAAHYAGNPIEDAFLDAVRYARPPWGARVERYPFIEELGREMMEDVLYGDVPVQEALDRAARLIDAVLAE